jgi:hypothetical protein
LAGCLLFRQLARQVSLATIMESQKDVITFFMKISIISTLYYSRFLSFYKHSANRRRLPSSTTESIESQQFAWQDLKKGRKPTVHEKENYLHLAFVKKNSDSDL